MPQAMKSFSSLLTEVRSCTLCAADLPLGPRPVVQLHPKAKILIAGQAPGRRVHESGVSFDDPSGNRLREWLGITPDVFYDPKQIALLAMGFCYPGTGKTGDLPPRPECAPAWREQLLGHLGNLKMTLVLGQYAQAYHFGKTRSSLTELVRSWQDYWPNMVPLPHPSPRNNLWLRRNPWFEEELLPVLRKRVSEILA
jgi:uracil-DNA glycosylase